MKILLANPRGFCAGVERAIKIVEAALAKYGRPVYVRHEIVHNQHVVAALAERGSVFVDELAEVPPGSTVVFSAHGVSPAVWEQARERRLRVVDATCPLVAKVHHEVTKHARHDRTVFLIGHHDHPEVVGTLGHYIGAHVGRILVVEDERAAADVVVDKCDDVAYVTQTTLSVDETAKIVDHLKQRFPRLRGPNAADICYATRDRQAAVVRLARLSDVVIVVGARHSSNSVRLSETAAAAGVPAYLIDSDEGVDRAWFDGVQTIGVTSGASVPERLVIHLLAKLREWWPDMTEESIGEPESIKFRLPRELEAAHVA